MAIFGYDDAVAGGSFRIRQTWGEAWGDGGYCWMPYSHFAAYPDFDAWRLADRPNVVAVPTEHSVCASCGQAVPCNQGS